MAFILRDSTNVRCRARIATRYHNSKFYDPYIYKYIGAALSRSFRGGIETVDKGPSQCKATFSLTRSEALVEKQVGRSPRITDGRQWSRSTRYSPFKMQRAIAVEARPPRELFAAARMPRCNHCWRSTTTERSY